MKLYNFNELFPIAEVRKMNALGSFNVHCIEMLIAYFDAAKQENSPLMLQISTGTAKYLGYELLVDSIKSLAASTGVPTCLHLDHCSNLDDIQRAIDAGFSSVMYDGSHLPFEENLANTQKVIQMAHPVSVTVEAELGAIGGSEDGKAVELDNAAFTSVDEVARFVDGAPVDLLAVSIGSVHGSYTAKTDIQHDLLAHIKECSGKTRLVLHGGTGVSDEDMKLVVRNGIDKVNVGTEMLVRWNQAVKCAFDENKENASCRNFFLGGREAVKNVVAGKIRLFK